MKKKLRHPFGKQRSSSELSNRFFRRGELGFSNPRGIPERHGKVVAELGSEATWWESKSSHSKNRRELLESPAGLTEAARESEGLGSSRGASSSNHPRVLNMKRQLCGCAESRPPNFARKTYTDGA